MHRSLGCIPRLSDSVGLGWGPRFCISHEFLDDADARGAGAVFWELLPKIMLFWEMFILRAPLGVSGI